TSSSVAKWKGARLLTGRPQVRLLPLEPVNAKRQGSRLDINRAQRRFDSGRDLHDPHAPFVQRQDGRPSNRRRGFDSRTGYRSSLGVSHWQTASPGTRQQQVRFLPPRPSRASAPLAARLLRVKEAGGSNPPTPNRSSARSTKVVQPAAMYTAADRRSTRPR